MIDGEANKYVIVLNGAHQLKIYGLLMIHSKEEILNTYVLVLIAIIFSDRYFLEIKLQILSVVMVYRLVLVRVFEQD